MDKNYKLVSDMLKETMNVSVSLPAYESLPTKKVKKKKKQKNNNPQTFKSQFPK